MSTVAIGFQFGFFQVNSLRLKIIPTNFLEFLCSFYHARIVFVFRHIIGNYDNGGPILNFIVNVYLIFSILATYVSNF